MTLQNDAFNWLFAMPNYRSSSNKHALTDMLKSVTTFALPTSRDQKAYENSYMASACIQGLIDNLPDDITAGRLN